MSVLLSLGPTDAKIRIGLGMFRSPSIVEGSGRSVPQTQSGGGSMTLQGMLSRFPTVKKSGSGYMVQCPAHEDKTPSLSLTEKDGTILLKCFAGCRTADIVAALGIEMKDLFPTNPYFAPAKTYSSINAVSGAEIAAFPYIDEHGTLLYENVRLPNDKTGKKRFAFRHYEADGSVAWGLNGQRRVPYRFHDVLQARNNGSNTLTACEGEKDADSISFLGFAATSFKKWPDEFSSQLQDIDVIITRDHDKPGVIQADDFARAVAPFARSIKILDFYDSEPLPDDRGKDVSDWINDRMKEGADTETIAEALAVMADAAPEWTQHTATISTETFDLLDIRTATQWLQEAGNSPIPAPVCGDLILEGHIAILFGPTGGNKSTFAVQIGDAVARGGAVRGLSEIPAKSQNVLFVDCELSSRQFNMRYSDGADRYDFHPRFLRSEFSRNVTVPEGVAFESYFLKTLKAAIVQHEIKFLIVDNITSLRSQTQDAKDALPLMRDLMAIKRQLLITLLILAHTPKRDRSRPIDITDLQGSAHIANLADSVFAINKSSQDPSLRYIVHLKPRDTLPQFTSDRAGVFEIRKDQHFLGLHFKGIEAESEHLGPDTSRTMALDEAKEFLEKELLAGEKSSEAIKASAAVKGIKSRTLWRAKDDLGVTARREGFDGFWLWAMPNNTSSRQVGSLGGSYDNNANGYNT